MTKEEQALEEIAAWKQPTFNRQMKRQRELYPNEGSKTKIQRYAFGMTQTLTLGTAVGLDLQGNPDTHLRPKRVTCNAPVMGFARLSSIKVANVGVIVGGEIDAFDFSSEGVDQELDVPTLSPANKIRVTGNYSGLEPTGYVAASTYIFTVSFKGPAMMVG